MVLDLILHPQVSQGGPGYGKEPYLRAEPQLYTAHECQTEASRRHSRGVADVNIDDSAAWGVSRWGTYQRAGGGCHARQSRTGSRNITLTGFKSISGCD